MMNSNPEKANRHQRGTNSPRPTSRPKAPVGEYPPKRHVAAKKSLCIPRPTARPKSPLGGKSGLPRISPHRKDDSQ